MSGFKILKVTPFPPWLKRGMVGTKVILNLAQMATSGLKRKWASGQIWESKIRRGLVGQGRWEAQGRACGPSRFRANKGATIGVGKIGLEHP